jgi:hypothetical protein
MESNKVIETIGLMIFYDPVKFQVIKGIDLSIDHGDFVSIEGVLAAENQLYCIYFQQWIQIMKGNY